MSKLPMVFVGHGSPMNTLEHNRYTDAWTQFARQIERPSAILAISAHWFVNASLVTAMSAPRTIHDFYGFPQELFDVQYPASGSSELANRVVELVKPGRVGLDRDSWGIDHGTWSVLAHMYPRADVPVVQLSIDASRPVEHHLGLGAQIAGLRDEGVLILASGNIVHNLRLVEWHEPDAGFEWAHRFDEAARAVMTSDPAAAGALVDEPDYAISAPTPDHFLPLLYLAGAAAATSERARVLVEGFSMGALSMTSYVVGDVS